MPRPPIVWLITDTHFFHNNLMRILKWPTDYHDQIIKNCRHLIAKQDLLFHLGDVILYRYPKLKEIMDKIPGKKILLKGNHDRKSDFWYMRNGFDFATEQIVWKSTKGKVLLSHRPKQIDSSDIVYNIHGHFHVLNQKSGNLEEDKPSEDKLNNTYNFYNPSTHFLLSCEQYGWGPVKLEDFLNMNIPAKIKD